jgi:hypothetical protein
MTMKISACAMTVALLAGTAALAGPAAARNASTQTSHAKLSSSHAGRQFLNAVAVYDAGLRRGAARSSRNAYLRGFRDGTSSEAYSGRGYRIASYAGYPVTPAIAYSSSYDSNVVYAPESGGYSSYDSPYGGGSVAYNENAYGYSGGGYVGGHTVSGLMDVAVEPMAMAAASVSRTAHWNYCVARYRSFDPASDTFLASDGNRYFCR